MTFPLIADRAGYTAGLRQLADILDDNPDLPLPYAGTLSTLNWIETHCEPADMRATAAQFTHLIPGTVTKTVRDDVLDLRGGIAGLKVLMIVSRDAVCQRVVTGTHEVTVPGTPARPAVDALPERTETVEEVEWVCGPILADAAVSS